MSHKKQSLANFGKGWIIIVFCIMMFFFYGGLSTDGVNVSIPACAERLGMEVGALMSFHSIAAIFGVLIYMSLASVIRKIGVNKAAGCCMMIGGLCYIIVGHAESLAVYVIFAAIMIGCMNGGAFICGGILVANYFPKRKGLVLGYTTWGLNICSICFVPILTILVNICGGFVKATVPVGIAIIVLGLAALFVIRSTPQEIGMIPDNVSKEEYERNYCLETGKEDDGGWTRKKLLTNKYVWLVAFTTGLLNIVTGCIIGNMVARNMEFGMTQEQAVLTMSVVACVGIAGSWLIGVMDDRIGTKKTLIFFAIFYCIGAMMNVLGTVLDSMACVYVSIVMIGIGIGGSANFTTSLPASVFGRHGFNTVNSVLYPIQGLIAGCCFLIAGLLRIITHDNLMWIYFAAGMISLFDVVLALMIKDEYKYNRDKNAELRQN